MVDEGAVLQAGPPAAVWSTPASRWVAVLLGLTNVIATVARRGWADTPWGRLPVPGAADGPISLLVQPGGVLLDPRGPLQAVVRSSTFQGVRSGLELEVADTAGGPLLQADVPSAAAPTAGQRVTVRVDAAAVVVLAG